MNLLKRIQDYLRTPITPELLEQWEKDIRLEEMDNILKEDMHKLEEALIKKDKL